MDRVNLRHRVLRFLLATLATGSVACSLGKQEIPALSGPSGLGRQVILTASPDQLPRDATSQSIVTVEMRGPDGKGVAGQIVTLGVTSGALLSQSQVTTGADGKASVAVVAPSQTAVIPNNAVVVTAAAVCGNAENQVTGSLSIALLGV